MIKFLGHLSCILDSLRMVYNFCFNVTSPLPIFFFFDLFCACLCSDLLCNMYCFINLASFYIFFSLFDL